MLQLTGCCALAVRQWTPLQQIVTTYNFQAYRAGRLLSFLQKKRKGKETNCVCSVDMTQASCLRHPVHSCAQGIIVALCFLHDK